MRAAHAGLFGGHREEPLHQLWIEGCAQADGLRKTGSRRRRVAVQALFMEDHWNAQASVFQEELLNLIGQRGHFAGVPAAAGVRGPAHLPDAAPALEGHFGFGEIEVALFVHQLLRLLLPDAAHLFGLLLHGHALQQILDARGWGQFGILVGRHGFGRGFGRCFGFGDGLLHGLDSSG